MHQGEMNGEFRKSCESSDGRLHVLWLILLHFIFSLDEDPNMESQTAEEDYVSVLILYGYQSSRRWSPTSLPNRAQLKMHFVTSLLLSPVPFPKFRMSDREGDASKKGHLLSFYEFFTQTMSLFPALPPMARRLAYPIPTPT